jgi:hypothetical protein
LSGRLLITVSENEGAAAIRYGLGFAKISGGILYGVEIEELAVVECLRFFIPFAELVTTFLQRIAVCVKPQMAGYLIEYLVSFALVANSNDIKVAKAVKAWQTSPDLYLTSGGKNEVWFPDHMCGPDIIYKCTESKTVYIVQVKFVKEISKQEIVKACSTTDPNRFYCKRTSNAVLKGFDKRRSQLLESLEKLRCAGFCLKQMVFVHTGGKQPSFTQGTLIVTKASDPDFFNVIGPNVWEFLDSVRELFNKHTT